jgi:pimeloyl-ACP methyl ester carboxylesterase
MVRTYVGGDVRAIVPSRFGYVGSQLPPHGTPALQADAYVALLDHLGADRTVVMGCSAGGPSAI